MKRSLLLNLLLFTAYCSNAQSLKQYFDGADTLKSNSIIIEFDTSSSNLWQVGRPQKTIFDSAATMPYALVTDTINNYPINNVSVFGFSYKKDLWVWGINALRWKQKIDLTKKHDGGIVEISVDSGKTWKNVFNNPIVYKFYGFDSSSKDTLSTGDYAFSGTDTMWRDIWLCFQSSYLHNYDSVLFRFTLKTDSIADNKEGWLIDNMLLQLTYMHTVKKSPAAEYLKIYPTPTTGIINIEAEMLPEFHIIEQMQLINTKGEVVEKYGVCPTKYYIDISSHPNGLYFLKIKTNKKTQTFRVLLDK